MFDIINTTCDWLNMFTKASERLCLAFIVENVQARKGSAKERAKEA